MTKLNFARRMKANINKRILVVFVVDDMHWWNWLKTIVHGTRVGGKHFVITFVRQFKGGLILNFNIIIIIIFVGQNRKLKYLSTKYVRENVAGICKTSGIASQIYRNFWIYKMFKHISTFLCSYSVMYIKYSCSGKEL